MRIRFWAALAVASAGLVSFVDADLTAKSATSIDINLPYREDCDAPLQNLNLGTFSVSLKDNGAFSDMRSVFKVTTGGAAPPASIFDCFELHWAQIVFNLPRNDPATYKGQQVSPPAPAAKKLPIVDVPKGGWDYMYTDGAGRTTPDPAFSIFIDDDPFYYTRNAEINSNDSLGQKFSTPGSKYTIEDSPADRAADASSPFGVQFTTYLVAEPKFTPCDDGTCLKQKELLILAGFNWHVSTTDISIESLFFGSNNTMAGELSTGLTNGDINGWTIKSTDSGVAVCCPEPATAGALLGFGLLTVRRRRAA